MNTLEDLINSIGDALLSDEFADSQENKLLAEEFAHYCTEFNRTMQECRRLMLENKLLEAESYAANISPKLELQLKMLNFPDKNRFLQLCKQYGYKLPPKLMTNIYEEVANITFTPEKDLANLLNYFRQIARTTDCGAKIRVLRKIVELAPLRNDMKETLISLEKIRLDELTAAAKEAICNQQYSRLADIRQELTGAKWQVQPNAMVLKKIDTVLREAEVARLNIQAKHLLDRINEAYSNFDFPALDKALCKWELLHKVNHLVPDESAAAQVAEAAAYCDVCRKEQQQSAAFAAQVQKLDEAVKGEAPQMEVEKLYNHAMSYGRGIPDEVEMRARQYLNTLEDVRRRRRLLILLVIFLAAAGIIAGIFSGVYTAIMKRREKEWAATIAEALEKEPSRVAKGMLDKLAAESPALRARASIKGLEAQVQAKAQQEDEHRKQLRILVNRIKSELKDFDRNKSSIDDMRAQALAHLVDDADKTLLQELDALYREQYESYVSRVDEKFIRAVEETKKYRQRYFAAMGKGDFAVAGELLDELLAMQVQLMKMQSDVSSYLRDEHQQDISAISRLQNHFNSNKEGHEKSLDYIRKLSSTTDAGAMLKQLVDIRTAYPDMVNGEKFAFLLQQLNDIPRFAPANEAQIAESVFAQDYAVLKNLYHADNGLRKWFLEYLQKNRDYYLRNPFYALVLKANGRIYDFYFQRNRTLVRSRDKVMISFHAEIDDRGNTEKVNVEVDEKNARHVMMEIYNDRGVKERFFAAPVWPDDLINKNTMVNYIAPHVVWFKDMAEKFSVPAFSELEMAQEICKFLRRQEVTPQARITIGIILLDEMFRRSGNPAYKAMSEALQLLRDREMQEVNWRKLYLEKYRNTAGDIFRKLEDTARMDFTPLRQKELQYKVYNLIVANMPRPAGFVLKRDGDVELAGLLAVSPENRGEVWAVSRTAPYFRVIGSFKGRKLNISPAEKAKLKEFQLLYTPGVAEFVTAELTAEIMQRAAAAGDKAFKFPLVWPQQQ